MCTFRGSSRQADRGLPGASAVDDAVATRKRHDLRPFAEKSAYEQAFIQCQYVWEDFPEVRPLTFHPAVAGTAAALLGCPRVRIWHDQALYKEAGGRETEAHQDHAYWPITERDAITAWIPLQEIDATNGCMGYVPGSHRGDLTYVDIFRSPGAGRILDDQTRDAVFVSCRPGDVIFHHGHTVHQAMPNESTDTRRVYTIIYFRDGCTRAAEGAHPSLDRDGIIAGEVIAGAATPIAWPLEHDHLPLPAEWPVAPTEKAASVRNHMQRLGVIPADRRSEISNQKEQS